MTLVTTACTQKEDKSIWPDTISSRKLLHYNSYTRVAQIRIVFRHFDSFFIRVSIIFVEIEL